MDALEKLIACEDIRQLLSRRTRLIDGKHWDQLVDVYTDDVVGHHVGAKGAQALVDTVSKVLDGVETVHQVHLPEIVFTSPTTASAIVPMEDLLFWEKDGLKYWSHGYGHYHQRFLKTDRGWRICDHKLTRRYYKEGHGDFDSSSGPSPLQDRFPQTTSGLPADIA